MRRTAALLVAVLAAAGGRAAQAQVPDIETRIQEAWRWRELFSPSREPSSFRSVRPWETDGLIAADKDGLATTDGYQWIRGPGWTQVGIGEVFDVVPARGGIFVMCDGSIMPIDSAGKPRQQLTLRHPRLLMPACRPPGGGAPLVALEDRILALESIEEGGARTVREKPQGSSAINAVAIDGDRALWAVTDEGLFRDAGSGWQAMRPAAGPWPPPRPLVRAVSTPQGLYFLPERIDPGAEPWYWNGRTLEALQSEGDFGPVLDATADGDGTLIVALGTPQLKLYVDGRGRGVRLPLPAPDNILSVCVTPQGRLALVTGRKQLWVCELGSRRWETYPTNGSQAGSRVNALAHAQAGGIWLATDRGIVRFHDGLFSDYEGVAGDTGVPLDSLTSIFEDDRGRLWVASGARISGVLCREQGRWRHYHGPQDAGTRYTHSIEPVGAALWFAQLEEPGGPAAEGQLVRWQDGVFTRFALTADGRPLPRCYDVVAGPGGRLFAAMLDDVYSFDGQVWSPLGITELDGARPFTLHVDPTGTLWIGLGLEHPGVLQWRDGQVTRLDEDDWHRVAAADFCQTQDGRLWFASLSGVFLAEGHECVELSTRLPLHEFWPILADRDGRSLWLGSLGSGLVHLQPDDVEAPRTFHEIPISFRADTGAVIAEVEATDRWQITPQEHLRFRFTLDEREVSLPVTWQGPGHPHLIDVGLLEPGRHHLTVVGKDMYGNVGTEPRLAVIDVPAPAWRSPPMLAAFFALAATIVAVALVLANRRRERLAAQRRQAELAERLSVLTRRLFSSAEDERRSLSRELHDDLGQALTSIGLDLQIAERKGQTESGRIATARALNTVRSALERVRTLSSMLRPAVLDDLGLEQAVRTVLGEFTTRTGVDGQLEIELGPARIPDAAAGHVYRILQEALTNVSRHAAASTVFVNLRATDTRIELTVKDDGQGFLTASVPTAKRFGLLGMRERSELMGGSFTLESAPGAGTTIHVSIPLKPPDPGQDPL